MKKHTQDLQNKTMILSIILVFGYVLLAFLSTIPFNEIRTINSGDSAYAGTQESVDYTAVPSSFLDGNDESVDYTASPRPTNKPSATPSSTPFDFFKGDTSPTPEPTIPPFDLNLPEEQANLGTPTPTPTQAPVVAGTSNQLLMIGGIVGAIVFILILVGVILLRRSRDNNPPPMMTQPGISNDLPPTPPNGPQYPPYINQQ